ncbi:MAG: hypothetical protein AAGD35_06150 [Actinomycetota bacterium]
MSQSDVQQRDVVEMLIANVDNLDRDYLDRWAEELGIAELLAAAWGKAAERR